MLRDKQDFMVPLSKALHRDLQDEAIRLTRLSGQKVHMTDIARRGIERELERLRNEVD